MLNNTETRAHTLSCFCVLPDPLGFYSIWQGYCLVKLASRSAYFSTVTKAALDSAPRASTSAVTQTSECPRGESLNGKSPGILAQSYKSSADLQSDTGKISFWVPRASVSPPVKNAPCFQARAVKTIDEVMSPRLEVLASKALHNYCLVFTLPFMCAKRFMILPRELLPATVKLPSCLFPLKE